MNFLIRSNSEEVVFKVIPAKLMFSTGLIVGLRFTKLNLDWFSTGSVISGSIPNLLGFFQQTLSLQGIYLV